MVEDPRLFFRPLLNQFNKLYQLVSSDKKSRTHQVDLLLVSEVATVDGLSTRQVDLLLVSEVATVESQHTPG